MSLALAEAPLALVQAAHEDPQIEKLSKAFEALDLLEAQLWIAKHVRPDRSYFVPKNTGPAGFGVGTKLEFAWGLAYVEIDGCIDRLTYEIRAVVFVSVGIWGKQQVLVLEGNLKDDVSGSFETPDAKGSVKMYLKNGNEVWARLDVSSPFFPDCNDDFKVVVLCEYGTDW